MTESPPRAPGPVATGPDGQPTVGALVYDLTQQLPELIRSELRLAQAELTAKGKRAGVGIGMFGGAGMLAFFAIATLIATVVLVLDLWMPAWVAALIVAVVLLLAAAIVALAGRKQVRAATPPMPERAIEGVKQDIETVKGGHR
jgi:uncharacterized membrane protein YqjE